MTEDLGKNVVTSWFWKSWRGKTSGLTWAERGLWIHLIEQTYTGALAGHYDGVLMELTGEALTRRGNCYVRWLSKKLVSSRCGSERRWSGSGLIRWTSG